MNNTLISNFFSQSTQQKNEAFNDLVIAVDSQKFAQLQANGQYTSYSFSEFKDYIAKNIRMFNDLFTICMLEDDHVFAIQLQKNIVSAQQGWDDHAKNWSKVANDYSVELKSKGQIPQDYKLTQYDLRHLVFGVKGSSFPRFVHDKVLRRLVVSDELTFDSYEKRIQALEALGLNSLLKWCERFHMTQYKLIDEAPHYKAA